MVGGSRRGSRRPSLLHAFARFGNGVELRRIIEFLIVDIAPLWRGGRKGWASFVWIRRAVLVGMVFLVIGMVDDGTGKIW